MGACVRARVCECVCVRMCGCVRACVISKLWLHAVWKNHKYVAAEIAVYGTSLAFRLPCPWCLLLLPLPQLSGYPTLPTLLLARGAFFEDCGRTVVEAWPEWSISGYGETSKQRLALRGRNSYIVRSFLRPASSMIA